MKGGIFINTFNIYCDESCHLEHDLYDVMVLGAVYCSSSEKRKVFEDVRNIKINNNLSSHFEIKWTKVSKSKVDFYLELLEYFINNDNLFYRGIVANGKKHLNNSKYNDGNYDLWYYKMYFLMLQYIINPDNMYNIMIDIKDTNGGKNVRKLKEILCNNIYDFRGEVVKRVVQINSCESEILQLADLLNGAIAYYHRRLMIQKNANQGKVKIVDKIKENFDINITSKISEQKFNLFIWKPQDRR